MVGNNYDSQLWKALAFARQGKWAEAREKFKNVEFAITSLPIDLQRIVTMDAMRASLEVKDYSGAAKRRSDLDVIGIPPELKPAVCGAARPACRGARARPGRARRIQVRGGLVRPAAAAEAKLLEIALRQKRNEISQEDALRELETLSVTWRGDAIEVKTLQMLARIYSETGRYPEVARGGAHRDQAAAQFRNLAAGPGRGGGAVRADSSSSPRATICRRSTRSGCSTNSAN